MKLVKYSFPSWEKEALSELHLESMLLEEICSICLREDDDDESYAIQKGWQNLPVDERIGALLSTACGCEYDVEYE